MLVIGFSLFDTFGPNLLGSITTSTSLSGPRASSLDSWLVIGRKGTVTAYTSKVDLGTGVLTALAQIIAEELDVSIHRIRMITGDTAQTIDQSQTSGSRTLHKAGPQLRQASAAARHELLQRAATLLREPVQNLTVVDGTIYVQGNEARQTSYWSIIGDRRFNVAVTTTGSGADLAIAPEIPAKNPSTYKIVGTSIPRLDLPAKLTGEFGYSQDVRIPGMLHGRVIRPLRSISIPRTVDETSLANIPGIVRLVRKGSFIGVVATTEWSAIKAAESLKVEWEPSQAKLPASREALYAYLMNTGSFEERVVLDTGEVDAELSQGHKVLHATYKWPFQMHGMIGPSCAVADVHSDGATVWTGSQGTHRTRKAVAELLDLAERDVRIVYAEGSGCYGRLCADDVAEDAALLSRAVGRPVRVQWMRGEEHFWEPKASAQLISVLASIDSKGKIFAWSFEDRFLPYTAGIENRLLASRQSGLPQVGRGTIGHGFTCGMAGGGDLYRFDHQRVTSRAIPWMQNELSSLRTSNLRAPGAVARAFASESFIDEVAFDLGVDPIHFRLGCETRDRRTKQVLQAAAARAGWKEHRSAGPRGNEPVSTGMGVACSNRDGTIVTAIAEVQVDGRNGKVSVTRITIAQDCGMIANPDGTKNQIEGNVLQGISRALVEEVQFDENGIKNLDWSSYPTLRFEHVPEIEIVLLKSPELGFLGVGEAAIIPVPAAIGNAIFDATGARIREAPFSNERIRRVLQR